MHRQILRLLFFVCIFFISSQLYANASPSAPPGCDRWNQCTGKPISSADPASSCVKQCKSGSVWFLGGDYWCCERDTQLCNNFEACSSSDKSNLNQCNQNICAGGHGMMYKNNQFGCCQGWKSAQCSTSCKHVSLIKSKAWFSISGRVVQCVKETLQLVFFSPECHNSANLLPQLQNHLRKAVYIMMVLYVVLFGMKITMSPQTFNKRELFTFLMKISLVFYFSVGLQYNNETKQGLVDVVYKGGLSAMQSFSGFVLEGAINNGLCDYQPSQYNDGFGYLALWDTLDCRAAYYLGMGRLFISLGEADKHMWGSISSNTSCSDDSVKDCIAQYAVSGSWTCSGEVKQFAKACSKRLEEGLAFGLVQLVIPLIFGLEIIESLVIIIFGVLVVSLVVFFVHFYVLCMFGLTVTVYLGVIMVPLSLFTYTKQFFDKWMSLVFSYIVQPCVVVAMCALLLMAMDQIVYPDCEFEPAASFAWKMKTSQSDKCHASLGGKLYNALVNGKQYNSTTQSNESLSLTQSWDLFFFSVTLIGDASYWKALASAFVKLIFFCYLFLMFAEGAGSLAAQLTGGPNIGELATNAAAAFNSFVNSLAKKPNEGNKKGDSKKSNANVSGAKRAGISVGSKK